MGPFAGQFLDGLSAHVHAVEVQITETGLAFAIGGREVVWAFADLRLVDEDSARIRLKLRSDEDARLVLPALARPALAERAPSLMSRKRRAAAHAGLIGALVAGSAAVAAGLFFGVPAVAPHLAQVTPPRFERQMGANLAAQAEAIFRPCEGADTEAAMEALTPLTERLGAASQSRFEIELTIVRTRLPNAFALPGGQVLITRGLIDAMESPDQLAAVIAHEIGHVEARDSMTGLYRNMGLGIALEAITGGSGLAQQAVLLAGQITDLSYTRRQEEAADEAALRIMDAAGHDPAALAGAFQSLGVAIAERRREKRHEDEDEDRLDIPDWLQSHPDLPARIKAAEAYARPGRPPALNAVDWAIVKSACGLGAQ